jgi:hypothetical protein
MPKKRTESAGSAGTSKRKAVLQKGSQAIRRTTTAKEAQGWRKAMRMELRSPGVSKAQRGLTSKAVKAVRDETTKKEAKGYRKAVKKADAAKARKRR